MDEELRIRIVEILRRVDDLTIATIRDDGFPQATTVSYASDGLTVYFGTSEISQKAANIARCNKVSATVNCPYASWDEIEGLSFAALAERVTDAKEMSNVAELMLGKFPQVKYVQPTADGLIIFRLTPVVFSVLDYRKGFGHTDLVVI